MSREITKRSLEIATFFIEHPDFTQSQIGKHFGISAVRVSQVLNHPRVTSHFPLLARRKVQSKLLPMALERYEKIIKSSDNDAVAEKAAGKVLQSERVFDAPVVKIENEITLLNVSALQQIVFKAAESGMHDVVDAELVNDALPPADSATQ